MLSELQLVKSIKLQALTGPLLLDPFSVKTKKNHSTVGLQPRSSHAFAQMSPD